MPKATASFDQPFKESIKYFDQKKTVYSPNSWRDVWKDSHARGFTVAQVTDADVLQEIQDQVKHAIKTGMTPEMFKAELKPFLEARGWYAPKGEAARDITGRKRLAGHRLDTIYHTNLASGYNSGRFKQQMDNRDRRPFLRYRITPKARNRPDHRAMNGRVYKIDSPVWNAWYPPNGFNCGCYVTALTKKQVEKRKHTVYNKTPKIQNSNGKMVRVQPDEGFDYHVGKAGLDPIKPNYAKYDKELRDQLRKTMALLKHPDWVVIPGSQLGTNPGAQVTGPGGQKYYAKFYSDENQARSEFLANSLMQKLGVGAPKTILKKLPGQDKLSILLEWIDDAAPLKDLKNKKFTLAEKKQLTKQYLSAVLTGNRDVVGFDFDNLVKKGRKWYAIDTGGSFRYRAQGVTKSFTADAPEFESILIQGRKAGSVFNPVLKDTLQKDPKSYIKWLNTLTDRKIKNSVKAAGLDDDLADLIILRRESTRRKIINKYETKLKKHHIRDHEKPPGKEVSVKWIMDDAKKSGAHIDKKEAEFVAQYIRGFSGSEYKTMRHAAMGRIDDSAAKAKVELIEEYLDVAARFDDKKILYRGMAWKRPVFEKLDIGDTYDLDVIASFSSTKSKALDFMGNEDTGVLLHFQGGTDYATTIQHISHFPHETEVLMSGRVNLRITDKQIINGRLNVYVEEEHIRPLTKKIIKDTIQMAENLLFAEKKKMSISDMRKMRIDADAAMPTHIIKADGTQILFHQSGRKEVIGKSHQLYNHTI